MIDIFTGYFYHPDEEELPDKEKCYEEIDVHARNAAEARPILLKLAAEDLVPGMKLGFIGKPSCGTFQIFG